MPSETLEVPGALLTSVYAVLEDRSVWPEALHQVCNYIGTPYASIITARFQPLRAFHFVKWGLPDEDVKEYLRRWVTQDPWTSDKSIPDVPVGLVANRADVCPDEVLEASEPYLQFLKPRNLHYGAAAMLLGSRRMRSMFGVLRPKSAGRLTPAEMERVRMVVPHLQRVLRIHEEQDALITEKDLLKGLFDTTGLGLVLLDQSGGVLAGNSRARSLLDMGKALAERDGRLHAVCKPDDSRLQAALSKVLDKWDKMPAAETVSLESAASRGEAAAAVRLLITPAQPAQPLNPTVASPAAVVHIFDPATPLHIDQNLLRDLFSFSRAEAQVAANLASGLSVAETASRLHVSEHTVRSHVKNLFLKTGANQQSALVSVILRLQPPLRVPPSEE